MRIPPIHNVLVDGVTVFLDHWQLELGLLALVFVSQGLIRLVLKRIFGNELTTSEYFLLGIAGWVAPSLLISVTWVLWGMDHPIPFGLCILAVVLLLLYRFKLDLRPASIFTSLILILFIFVSIILRQGYISKALFPLYFDSAQHYSIIKNILEGGAGLLTTYYHQGFHFLSAFTSSFFHAKIAGVMLVLGQVTLALISFAFFFPVRHGTGSDMAGWFAVILSAFGWYMPAHAVDWGKYPALMSLGLILFVLSVAYLFSQNKNRLSVRERWVLYGILGMGGLLSVFTHSRSLVIFGIVLLAWILAGLWQKLPRKWMVSISAAVIVATVLEIVFIQRQGILALLFDPYLNKGISITALVIFLSVFAWLTFPRLTFVSVLTVIFLLGSLFIPVTIVPGYRDLTLLDRPFVEMILFMPLAMLGGLGLAGLQKILLRWFSWGRYVGLLAIGFVAINALFTYNFYPSDCCVIVGNDDVVAMDWIASQLPVDARIGIASTELKVMASGSFEGDVGSDAGIWIAPLTGRATFPLPNDFEFDQQSTLEQICELGIGYLYIGEIGQPFDAAMIGSHPEWYRPLLSMPETGVYEVIGCDN
jgi:hypothetical protein